MPRYPRGITKSAKGWRISVRVKGHPRWKKRFPPKTDLETVEAALHTARKARRAGRQLDREDTFAADVRRYLIDYYAGRPGLLERTRHLKLWTETLGADTKRADVHRDDIARALNGWRAAGLGADTCNKRRTALLALYHALDGKGGSNPVREVPKFRPPDPLPRGLPYRAIEAALKKLPRCKTAVRLTLMAYTGIRQGQMMALTPDHWDRAGKTLTIPGTSKGRGTKPYVVPLSPQAQCALEAFDASKAWGRFTVAPMARLWRQAWYAMTRNKRRTPTLVVPAAFQAPVPYDLRHSFGTAIYRETGDLKVTKDLMGHSAIRITERYMLAAIPERQAAAVKAFGRALRRKAPRTGPTRQKS